MSLIQIIVWIVVGAIAGLLADAVDQPFLVGARRFERPTT
jgi:uncharacterized membrane protein YeaQ/YmgE (transglycosylase-associated protein family)